MKVILTKDVAGIGRRGEVKDVSDGHALNYLFPRKLALLATPVALKNLESEKIKSDTENKIQNELLEKNLKQLNGKKVFIKAKASETGALFAGIHKEELSKHIKSELYLDIPAEIIELEHPIKQIGTHKIKVGKTEFELVVESITP